eukprot:COSAG01_NODE_675_length_14330_cov_20.977022_7_plen_130_part_00
MSWTNREYPEPPIEMLSPTRRMFGPVVESGVGAPHAARPWLTPCCHKGSSFGACGRAEAPPATKPSSVGTTSCIIIMAAAGRTEASDPIRAPRSARRRRRRSSARTEITYVGENTVKRERYYVDLPTSS